MAVRGDQQEFFVLLYLFPTAESGDVLIRPEMVKIGRRHAHCFQIQQVARRGQQEAEERSGQQNRFFERRHLSGQNPLFFIGQLDRQVNRFFRSKCIFGYF